MAASTKKRPARAAGESGPPAPKDALFHWTAPNGSEVVLPNLAHVERTFALMEAIADGDQQKITVRIIQSAATPEGLETIRGLSQKDLTKMLNAWSSFSGIRLGN